MFMILRNLMLTTLAKRIATLVLLAVLEHAAEKGAKDINKAG